MIQPLKEHISPLYPSSLTRTRPFSGLAFEIRGTSLTLFYLARADLPVYLVGEAEFEDASCAASARQRQELDKLRAHAG